MAHIDTSKITGFETMTPEEKVAALTAFDIPDEVDMSGYVKKTLLDAKMSELAEVNKKLKGKMSEDELAQAERAAKEAENKAAMDDLQSKYDAVNKQLTVMKYASKYLALGYDEELAKDTAEAMASGNYDKVFENGEKHKTSLEAKIKEKLMMDDPRPGSGSGAKGDSAVEKAKELAKAKSGNAKAIEDAFSHYTK